MLDYLGRFKVAQLTGCLDLAGLRLRSLQAALPPRFSRKPTHACCRVPPPRVCDPGPLLAESRGDSDASCLVHVEAEGPSLWGRQRRRNCVRDACSNGC